MQINSIVIDEKSNLNEIKYSNHEVTIFVDTFMSTEIYLCLSKLSESNEISIYIKNIGKSDVCDIEMERNLILKNDADLTLDNYRPYKLFKNALNNYIDAKVGIISDEIQFTTLENTTNLFYINEDTCDFILDEGLDVMIFITTWHGLYGEYRPPNNEPTSKKLHRLLQKIKSSGIPIVFYSKEDPTNFNGFKTYAQYADLIFTSSYAKIPEYQALNPEATVKLFTYGMNSTYCAPIGIDKSSENFMFAGTWWNEKYNSRIRATKDIFEYVEKNSLNFTYYNRNYHSEVSSVKLPDKYKKYEQPALPYNKLISIYPEYKYHFNLNSVIDDETMFAVRILELQAMGKKIISNYSLPVYVDYPNISIFDDSLSLEFPIEDKILGIRNTFEKNSIFDFWIQVFLHIGLEHLVQTNKIIFLEELSELERLDVTIGFKTFDVGAIAFTMDESEYYTLVTDVTNFNIVARVEDSTSNKILLLPVSKFYTFSKQLIIADIFNYKQVAQLNNTEYIIALDPELKNRKYINELFKNFELLSDYTIRKRRVPNQNMDCLALINLLNYAHSIELVEFNEGIPTRIGKIDNQSVQFKQMVYEYKVSINKNEFLPINYNQIVV